MFRYFDNSLGKVRCIIYALDKVEEVDASPLSISIFKTETCSPMII